MPAPDWPQQAYQTFLINDGCEWTRTTESGTVPRQVDLRCIRKKAEQDMRGKPGSNILPLASNRVSPFSIIDFDRDVKPNKPFLIQVAFDQLSSHSNRKPTKSGTNL